MTSVSVPCGRLTCETLNIGSASVAWEMDIVKHDTAQRFVRIFEWVIILGFLAELFD